MGCNPFRVYSEKELDTAVDTTISLAKEWSRQWFGHSDVSVSVLNAFLTSDSVDSDIDMAFHGDGVFFLTRRESYKSFFESAFGERVGITSLEHPICEMLFCKAVMDLLGQRVSPGESIWSQRLPTDILIYGAGWLKIEIRVDLDIVFIGFINEAVANMFGVPEREFFADILEVKEVISVLDGMEVDLSAELGSAFVDIKTLNNLEVGDVVKLDLKIDEEIQVHSRDGVPVLSGHVCKKNGANAVVIQRALVASN